MKTLSKITCATVLGLMSLSGANALTTAEIQAMCANSDKTVWDSKNNVCVPRAVCHSSNPDHAKYCNKTFSTGFKFPTLGHPQALVNIYAKYHFNSACSLVDTSEINNWVGQDEIGCKLSDGSYMSFEFDSIDSNSVDIVTSHWAGGESLFASGVCAVLGGNVSVVSNGVDDTNTYLCLGMSQQQCNAANSKLNGLVFWSAGNSEGFNSVADQTSGCLLSGASIAQYLGL